jgi:hypothetical protein
LLACLIFLWNCGSNVIGIGTSGYTMIVGARVAGAQPAQVARVEEYSRRAPGQIPLFNDFVVQV